MERRIKEEYESGLVMKGENGMLKKKCKLQSNELIEKKKKLEAVEAEQRKLVAYIKVFFYFKDVVFKRNSRIEILFIFHVSKCHV